MNLVMLRPCRDAMEANLLRQLLENEGIPATTMGESLSAARGELPLTLETLPSVWVRREDVERANAALEQAAEEARQARREEEGDEPEDQDRPRPVSATSTILWTALCLGAAGLFVHLLLGSVRGFPWTEISGSEFFTRVVTILLLAVGIVGLVAGTYLLARRYRRSRRGSASDIPAED